MLKIILIATLSLIASCGSAPKMPRKVKVYKGRPDLEAICRLTTKEASQLSSRPKWIIKQAISGAKKIDMECIDTSDALFSTYGALSFDDIGVVQKYIETLIHQCKAWK